MRVNRVVVLGTVLAAGSALLGCLNNTVILNNTAPLLGNVQVVYVNNTSAAAIFSYGSWNDLDRPSVREVVLRQTRIEANATTSSASITCGRNFAVATQDLVDWVRETAVPDSTDFVAERLNATVFFSNQTDEAVGEETPSAGTAEGLELLLGVHYSCGDTIVITFEEDASAVGGYRIDYVVIKDEERNI